MARFASLLLLPLYTHYLTPADYGQVETLTALVAVAVTIAQLGMVNALFRFALERQGEARAAVIRTALATCAVSGLVVSTIAALLTPIAAPLLLGPGTESLWLLSCVGLWISLVYEPTVGLYRVEQRPTRYLAITVVNVAVTIALSATLVITPVGQGVRARRRKLRGHRGRARGRRGRSPPRPVRLPRPGGARPDAPLRPSVRSLAPRALGAQPVEPPVPARVRDAGGRRRARARRAHRDVGRARGDGVPAGVAAVRVLDRGRRGGPARLPRRPHVVVRARLVARARTRPAALSAALRARRAVEACGQPDGAGGGRLRLLRRLLRRRRRDRPGQADRAELDRHGHRGDRERRCSASS